MSEPLRRAPLPTALRVAVALFALAVLFLTKDAATSWADGSRLGTIQALGEHGTLALGEDASTDRDTPDFLWQGDKVSIEGRFYSHQPPMLALIGAPLYAVLHHGLGLDAFDPWTYRLLTWFLVGLPTTLGLWALAHLVVATRCGTRWATALVLLAGFGTLLLPYATVLNQHGAAAGWTMLALLALARGKDARAGFLLALAATIDLSAAFCGLAGLFATWRRGGLHTVIPFVLGAAPPLSLHAGLNLALVGDLLPLGVHTELFEYPLSPFMIMSLTGGERADLAGTQAVYVWRALFGQSGLFSHHPWLLLAALCGVLLAVRRTRTHLPPGILPAVAIATLGIAGYYLTQSRNFGGSAFGMRWFTVFAPLFALWPAAWIGARGADARPGSNAALVAITLGLWSVGAALLGTANPWAKFAYLPSQRPEAMLAQPGDPQPTRGEHLRAEWNRVQNNRWTFTEAYYENWYRELVFRVGRVRTKRWPGFDDVQARAWVEGGIEVLEPVAALLPDNGSQAEMRTYVHFWLGKLNERIGRDWSEPEHVRRARWHYRKAQEASPTYAPVLQALERLNADFPLGPGND